MLCSLLLGIQSHNPHYQFSLSYFEMVGHILALKYITYTNNQPYIVSNYIISPFVTKSAQTRPNLMAYIGLSLLYWQLQVWPAGIQVSTMLF